MKNKHLIYIIVLCMVFSLCGCTLARPDGGMDSAEGRDRLIGCFITTEHIDLFDFEAYFNDNASDFINGGDVVIDSTEGYEGRIYAEYYEETLSGEDGDTITTSNYRFPGLEGIACFAPRIENENESYITFQTGEGLQDVHNHVKSHNEETYFTELSAKLYVPVDNEEAFEGDELVVYLNPVYQSADGSVYLMSGNGMACNSVTAGMLSAMTISEETTVTIDGEKFTGGGSVEISIEVVDIPIHVKLIEMSEDGRVLASAEFRPDALPEEYEPQKETEYIILETYALDSEGAEVVERCIIAPGTGDEDIYVLVPGGNGFMAMDSAEVLWDEE